MSLPQLRPDQWEIARHPAKVKVVCMGRRWGKTTLGGSVGLATAAAGGKVGWAVPIYKNGRPLWRFAEQSLGGLRRAGLVSLNKADRLIEFATGGFLGIYSMDNPDGLRGEALDLFIGDEAALYGETAWTDVVQPTLADRDGDALLIFTPNGRNWVWREWVRGKEEMGRGGLTQASWNAPSSDNPNPRIKRAAALARERVPERTYRQEWLPAFLEDGGGVFRRVDEAATVTAQERALPGHVYAIGVDWGKLRDWTVFSVLDITAGEQVAQERMQGVDYTTVQVERLADLCRRFRPAIVAPELNSVGVPLVEHMERLGLPVVPFVTNNASKKEMVELLALSLERQQLRILRDPQLLEELKAFEAQSLPSGLTRYGAPEGVHDDCVMALGIAVYMATGGQPADRIETYGDRVEIGPDL